MHIYPYMAGSKSVKALAQTIGAKVIKREGSKFKGGIGSTVLNWGCSTLPNYQGRVINSPEAIAAVTNKLTFFTKFGGDDTDLVPFATQKELAVAWLAVGQTVVVRHKLTGHSGEGIEIVEGEGAELPNAPLYTLYVPKKDEYRIHVVRTAHGYQVFDRQRKARDLGNENPNWKVRNHANGFVYARDGIDTPQCVDEVAIKILEATGLDFGAVDVIYNDKNKKASVLEVNTAPGLTGTTLERYTVMVKENFE